MFGKIYGRGGCFKRKNFLRGKLLFLWLFSFFYEFITHFFIFSFHLTFGAFKLYIILYFFYLYLTSNLI